MSISRLPAPICVVPFSLTILLATLPPVFAQQQSRSESRDRDSAAADPFAPDGGEDPFGSPAPADPFGTPSAAEPANRIGVDQIEDTEHTKQAPTLSPVVARSSFSANEKRILANLEHQTPVQYLEVPLRDALEDLQLRFEIPLVLDLRALEREEIGTDTAVSLNFGPVPLKSTLEFLVAPLDLTYIVDNDLLVITSREAAHRRRQIRVYDLAGLKVAGPTPQLVELLRNMTGEYGTQVDAIQDQLVVKDSFAGQQRVMQLLMALQQ